MGRGPRPAGDRKRETRGPYQGPGGERPSGRFFKRKTCRFCAEKGNPLDYKDLERLTRFLTEKGKIIPRRITGNCAKCQRRLARVIKRARHIGFVAFQID
ncbi:MAG: 30S ribosomal protein S18 [Candidatus Omnitrophica bacterium]|nr:30S ribosomal protein S18 [Candidatus Omnitrophota bacterium]